MRSGDPAIEYVNPRLLVWRERLATIGGRTYVGLEAAARAPTAVNRAILWREHTDCLSGTCGRRHTMRSGDPAIESVTPRLLVWRERLATIGGRAYVARGSRTRVNDGQSGDNMA